jgi:hypothetical protein
LQLGDVILDTPHYGAGSSCYDLFSYNLPIVTLPGDLVVGRVTQVCYRKMGVADLVVHSPGEYVSKAVQVATDRDYRKYVTERNAQASDVLFNDLEAVREHERFFEEILAGSTYVDGPVIRRDRAYPSDWNPSLVSQATRAGILVTASGRGLTACRKTPTAGLSCHRPA